MFCEYCVLDTLENSSDLKVLFEEDSFTVLLHIGVTLIIKHLVVFQGL